MSTPPGALAEPGIFQRIPEDHLALLAEHARQVDLRPGAALLREGDPADVFYVLRAGKVAIELFVPSRGLVPIETVGAGGLVGWSWLFPPYRFVFDAHALSPVTAHAVDGARLRSLFTGDPAFAYDVLLQVSRVLAERLHATRLRLLDVYGNPDQS
ncbi:cyclic nucleotide-binding domain-containing protein [Frankia sp. AgB1.9]|uniref:Crp/Fnr family transcriptional regulator n=1 Tax=unclassified Frankia TaxID=2632575 RepID=UPI00193238A0|nr:MULTISPECIES: cyclic nucleotide-binding domain-containing protein [unclassified Frankia]MBL7487998.1 cyclic nucleotide-binding domain-containing protein [Frankia sp. AgW1.1]MBL7549436.1 cyclic nucleotide-binding domain-containing protein [Frankia sp. AgB1.9]MBL7619948.1 cyclic nucleotide-binding domain-containing protein [Frankia sp. AgB1.8]